MGVVSDEGVLSIDVQGAMWSDSHIKLAVLTPVLAGLTFNASDSTVPDTKTESWMFQNTSPRMMCLEVCSSCGPRACGCIERAKGSCVAMACATQMRYQRAVPALLRFEG